MRIVCTTFYYFYDLLIMTCLFLGFQKSPMWNHLTQIQTSRQTERLTHFEICHLKKSLESSSTICMISNWQWRQCDLQFTVRCLPLYHTRAHAFYTHCCIKFVDKLDRASGKTRLDIKGITEKFFWGGKVIYSDFFSRRDMPFPATKISILVDPPKNLVIFKSEKREEKKKKKEVLSSFWNCLELSPPSIFNFHLPFYNFPSFLLYFPLFSFFSLPLFFW